VGQPWLARRSVLTRCI